MPADEVTHGTDVEASRVRTGPRHAAPRKPLLTRIQMPAGKAIAIAAMPTAVLMGMGFVPTLAQADDHSTSKTLTADEYQACVEAVTGTDASATPTPSASASASASSDQATPTPSASSESAVPGKTSSSDSGSDDKATPTPSGSSAASTSGKVADSSASTPTPSASASTTNPLDPLGVGDAIKDILTPDETASSTPAPSASASASASASDGTSVSDTVKDTTGKVADTVDDTTKKATDTASKAASDTTETDKKAADAVTESPSPSASATTNAADCPVATDDTGGVDNAVTLPVDPWHLSASSLTLKGADYQGIVKVRTADGTIKKVLKYVISDGTDIGDLHQTVDDKLSGKTYHVQAAKGSTSTIRDGKTIMYTESISGNLLGLIPITFDPDNPPPLNIPLIYFTKVTVVQAGQFGGTLTVPGLHQYTTG
ncbi:hypothetical protein [Streptomyces sp. NPDC091209]|uniref:hypothetical protein n=1 Tax=Streptomyces sp. NPDC091209 TaxID=3365974 RepID=UPI00382BF1A0